MAAQDYLARCCGTLGIDKSTPPDQVDAIMRAAKGNTGKESAVYGLANAIGYLNHVTAFGEIITAAKAVADEWRANRPPKRRTAPDPYWSLWGKLRARATKHAEFEGAYDTAESGIDEKLLDFALNELADEWQHAPLCLPQTGLEVRYDGHDITIQGHGKRVKSDAHAVNWLKKMDCEESYRRSFLES